MKQPTQVHIDAIAHAQLFLEPAIDKQPEPRFRRAIERDIELLAEVKKMLIWLMYNPSLPFDKSEDLEKPGP